MGWLTAQVGNGQQVITFIIPQEQLYTLCNAQWAVMGYQIKTKMFFSVSGQEKIANYDKHRVKPAD